MEIEDKGFNQLNDGVPNYKVSVIAEKIQEEESYDEEESQEQSQEEDQKPVVVIMAGNTPQKVDIEPEIKLSAIV